MASIILPSRWQRQPSGDFVLDWRNPLTQGMAHCYVGGDGYAVNRVSQSLTGTPTGVMGREARPDGIAIAGTRSAYVIDSSGNAPTALPLTIGVVAGARPNGNGPLLASFTPGSVGSAIASVGTGFTGNAYPRYLVDYDSSIIINDTSAESSLVNTDRAFVCRSLSATDHALIVGRRITTNTTSRTVVSAGAQVGLGRTVGHNYSALTLSSTAWATLACMWYRGLCDAEAFEFNAAPWQVFRPRRRVVYFDAPAAGPQVRELAGALGISFVLSANLSRGAIFAESAFAGAADEALETLPEWDKSTMLGTTGIGRYLDQAYLRAPLNTDTALYTHADAAPTADYSVEMDWIVQASAATFNTRVGIAGRAITSGFYSLEYLGGTKAGGTPRFELRRYDNGTGVFTALASYAFDVVATTYRVELRMVGSTISARLDGTQIMSVADTTLTAPGLAGLYGNTDNVGNWRGDNFDARLIASPAVAWPPKYYDGGAWQAASAAHRYDGSAWQSVTAAPVVI